MRRTRPPPARRSARAAAGSSDFGSASTKNFCNKCYRDHLKAIDVAPDAGKIKSDEVLLALPAFKVPTSQDSAAAAAEAPAAASAPAKKAAPRRCMACKKKAGLLGFACRCGGTFCSLHRYMDAHACDFDYKKAAREQIAKQNPLVVAPKITKF